MKKILVLSFVLLFAIAASSQTLYMYVGDTDGSAGEPVSIGIDKNVDIPVYFMCEVDTMAVGSFNTPLAINNEYADHFDSAACYYDPTSVILIGGTMETIWDTQYFSSSIEDATGEPFDSYSGGPWDSFSMWAIKDVVGEPEDCPPFTSIVPEIIGHFVVHTVNDVNLIGQTTTNMLNPGIHIQQGEPNAGDITGNVSYDVVMDFASYFFSPNQGVTVEPQFNADDYCTYVDFQLPFDVIDPDGDPVDVQVSAGTVMLVGSEAGPTEDAVTYHYVIDFDMETFCGQCLSEDIVITAVDGSFSNPLNDPVVVDELGTISVLGQMTAYGDTTYIWPGFEDYVPFYLDVCADCFCLGGFVFTLEFDASVLTVTEIVQGPALMGGEYWNVNMEVAGIGTYRVSFINDLNNGHQADEICGLLNEPVFYVKYLLALLPEGQEYPVDMEIKTNFMFDLPGQDNYQYNNVADAGGYHVWFNDGCDDAPDSVEYGTLDLQFAPGIVYVLSDHNLVYGDVNWNGHPFEVGDVVTLANYLIDPISNPLNLRQRMASNVNGDQISASIADLIYMINYINGYNDGVAKVAPLNVAATVTIPAKTFGDVNISVNSEAAVGGAVVEISHAGVELGVPTVEGMDLTYSDNGNVMTVAVYNMKSVSFAPGSNTLFTLPVLGEGDVTISNVQVSDARGALLAATGEIEAAIPECFSVAQNFPNPFNAKTSISFGLPTSSDVNISIYNVAGQLVESMNLPRLNAGEHNVLWDASNVASGVYFYKVTADNHSETMKMTLLK